MARSKVWTRRGRTRRWIRRMALAGLIVVLAPLVLTLLYAIPFVHPVSTLMLKDLATFKGYERQWTGLDDIAPVLVHSVIMSEDGQFCGHHGIDWRELNAVINDAMVGEATRGASTIPMQTVKNLYLWQRPLVALRKLVELPLAVYLDLVLSKRRIMEIYLNIVELGPNIYGVEAASRHHFGKAAKDLSRREAALLAATLPNPIARDPAKPSSGMRRIAAVVERRARAAGAYVACIN